MSNHLRFAVATLVFSLTCSAIAASDLVIEHTLAQTATTSNEKAQADKLFEEGIQQYRTGKYPQALQTYEKVLSIRRQQGDKALIAKTLNNIGEVYLALQLDEKALEVLQPALVTWQELKNKAEIGETLTNIGDAYYLQEQYDKSLEILQQALTIRREVGDKADEAKTLSQIGKVYNVGFKQYTKALETLKEALNIQKAAGDKLQTGLTLIRLGAVYSVLKDYPHALESAQQAVSLNQEIKNRAKEGESLYIIAAVYALQNKYEQALQLCQQALVIARESGNRSQEFQTIWLISLTYQVQNQVDIGLQFGQQALDLARQNKLRRKEMEALDLLASLYWNRIAINQANGNYTLVKSDATRTIEFSQQSLIIARELKIRVSEAGALVNMGNAYDALKEYQKAIDVLQQAASIARERKDLDAESHILNSLDSIYLDQGDNLKIIDTLLRVVEINREQKDRLREAFHLINLGDAYRSISEFKKAVDAHQQAITAARQIDINKQVTAVQDHALSIEYRALDGLSRTYKELGQYDKAVDFAQQALKYTQTIRKPNLEAQALIALSFLYTNSIKDFKGAITFGQQALTIAKQIKAPDIQAEALDNLSNIYSQQGNQQKALEYANQTLEFAKQLENPILEFQVLNKLIGIYENQGNYNKVLELAQQQLTLVQKAKLGNFEALVLVNVTKGYVLTGDTTKAVETAKQAITLAKQQNAPDNEMIALYYLAQIYRNSKPATAISYYKQSINKIQAVRRSIQGLPPELQQSFLNTKIDVYKELIDLLASQGRNAEATQVSELLKLQEIRDISFNNEDTSKAPSIPLNSQEQQIQKNNDSRIALGQKIYRCEKNMDTCSDGQLKEMRDESDKLREEFDQQTQELEKLTPKLKEDFARGYQTIVEAQPGTVLIQPIVLDNKIWILWASAGGILGSKQVTNVGQNQLWKTVKEYRDLLSSPGDITKLQATSKQLYEWLIAPIESEVLKDKGIKNLVFSLDGATRYIPIGALFDGQKYLIEKYTISTVPTVSLTNSSDRLPKEAQKTPVLALGVSQGFPQFPALPNVLRELNAIKSIYPAEEIVNAKFNLTALRDNLKGQKIIHIATHGQFLSNNPKSSYLLLGTGEHWTIREIGYLRNLSNVHLIVLSACETALGEATQDGKEILGISDYLIGSQDKAKAVMASLWSVDDLSTTKLMQQFYQNLASGKTKSEALQQAQLSLLLANNSNKKDVDRGINVEIIPGASSKQPRASGYSHPYYWAPFILIGNGL